MSRPIRILIADDDPLFRAGLRALLESIPDTEVAGEAATGEEAVEVALALVPDVVVMDINMPGLNGIDATRRIVDASEDVKVLVMTMHDDDEAVFAAIRAGARGYHLKGRPGRDASSDPVGRERRGHLRAGDRQPAAAIPRSDARTRPEPSISAAHRPRAGDPATPRRAPDERRDRRAALPQPEDRPITCRPSSQSSRSPTAPRPASSREPPGSESDSSWRSSRYRISASLAAGPGRPAFLQEGAHPLLCVAGLRVRGHHAPCQLVGPVLVELDLPVERLLADPHRGRARRRDPLHEGRHRVLQLVGRDDLVDEPPSRALPPRRSARPRSQHFERALATHRP